MKHIKHQAILIMALVAVAVAVPLAVLIPGQASPGRDPWAALPSRPAPTDHSSLMKGPFPDGPSVTRACLACHKDSATQVMHTKHWSWQSEPMLLPGREAPVVLGKKFALNNFCISVQPNLPRCTSCHAGYGWTDDSFDFENPELVDCLVCHDQSGQYAKGLKGLPAEGVDLLAAAKSVGYPSRQNCGGCHFRGGGGNAVKHGDLDNSLMNPGEHIDVHMGRHGMVCTDCHQSQQHNIKGRAISVSFDNKNQVHCTDCHDAGLHRDPRINAHVAGVACQSCHIPAAAVKTMTKVHWDWSEAGQDLPEDPHHYLKKKGKFEYAKHLLPEYHWYNGIAEHHVMGDTIQTGTVTSITHPLGDIADSHARIWPFKVHRGTQIYDKEYLRLISPKTYGEGGYWTDFDWDKAARLGSEAVGQPYSGSYGFTPTEMYWPITHMVSPKEHALRCVDCHGDATRIRMNWYELGYDGDPIHHGGRVLREKQAVGTGREAL